MFGFAVCRMITGFLFADVGFGDRAYALLLDLAPDIFGDTCLFG